MVAIAATQQQGEHDELAFDQTSATTFMFLDDYFVGGELCPCANVEIVNDNLLGSRGTVRQVARLEQLSKLNTSSENTGESFT